MLQISKRLEQERVRVTLVTPLFFCKTLHKLPPSIALETISDGFDNGRQGEAAENKLYFDKFRQVGTETLSQLIEKLKRSGNFVDCVVYDAGLPWVLGVAKRFGIVGAVFMTQNIIKNISGKGLIVTWCPQLQVLADESVCCFVTHCGLNSTFEAMSLGVPMVAVPQWSDQPTNAKYIMDFWKMGLMAPVDENGIVRGEALKHCIKEIMETKKGIEIKRSTLNWKTSATLCRGKFSQKH
ncbi:hypothetical protein L6164_000296 [Bauhinia variegata]|uniref:Uncharacterized protein n=1 Tax=Bauhinia variegata TaxID=167791 RepID=A0ACB9Q638_BAUVA|nr:hypothetical protein L6164_000296 [Bauhinia variegata]